jgi:hypothetical protein
MKYHFVSFLGSVALSLLANQALAIRITSTSSQTGRVEGQSATISATVDWEQPALTPVNPLEKRGVTATVQNNALSGVTAVPLETSVDMVLNSSGSYQGVFTNLPFGNYTIKITATRKVTELRIPSSITTTTSASVNRGLSIGIPAGCFTFPNHSLQGFTAQGFFDGDTSTLAVNQTLNPLWDPLGFFGPTDGSFSVVLAGTQPPLSGQVSGFFRWDVVSPDLTNNAAWQGITGVSFRFRSSAADEVELHAIARIRDAAGSAAVFTQFDGTGKPIFAGAFAKNFQTMMDRFTLPAGSTVVGVDVRAFARPGHVPPNFLYDSICPLH